MTEDPDGFVRALVERAESAEADVLAKRAGMALAIEREARDHYGLMPTTGVVIARLKRVIANLRHALETEGPDAIESGNEAMKGPAAAESDADLRRQRARRRRAHENPGRKIANDPIRDDRDGDHRKQEMKKTTMLWILIAMIASATAGAAPPYVRVALDRDAISGQAREDRVRSLRKEREGQMALCVIIEEIYPRVEAAYADPHGMDTMNAMRRRSASYKWMASKEQNALFRPMDPPRHAYEYEMCQWPPRSGCWRTKGQPPRTEVRC